VIFSIYPLHRIFQIF